MWNDKGWNDIPAEPMIQHAYTTGSPVAPEPQEKMLLRAIFVDAIHNLIRAQLPYNVEIQEDLAWMNKEDCAWLFSFENCCQVLGFDAAAMRSQVRLLMEQHQDKRPVITIKQRHMRLNRRI
jgi:hypothetical protein